MTQDEYQQLEFHVELYWVDAFRHRGVPWASEKRQALFGRFRDASLTDAKFAVEQEFARYPDEGQPNWNRIVATLPERRPVDPAAGWQAEIDRENVRFRDRWTKLDAKGKTTVRALALELMTEIDVPDVVPDPYRDSRFKAWASEAMDLVEGRATRMSRGERTLARMVQQHRNHETVLANLERVQGRQFPYREPAPRYQKPMAAHPEGGTGPALRFVPRRGSPQGQIEPTGLSAPNRAVSESGATAESGPPKLWKGSPLDPTDFDLSELEAMALADEQRRAELLARYPETAER